MERRPPPLRWERLGAPVVAFALLLAACAGGGGAPAPTITATNPAADATGVPVTATIAITFSQAMNEASVQTAFSSAPAIACGFGWNAASTVMTCTPAAELAPSTAYEVTVAASAASAAGRPLGTAFSLEFTTGAAVTETCVFGTSQFGACRFGP